MEAGAYRYFIGVDYHKRYTYLTVKDGQGRTLREGEVENKKVNVQEFVRPYGREAKAVMEATRNWSVMYEWLAKGVGEVILAHPMKTRAIAEAKIKTDRIDAGVLAHLLRSDLVAEAYVPSSEAREAKQVLRQRMFFVMLRTMLKNRVHGIVDRYPEERMQFTGSDLFGKSGRAWLETVPFSAIDRQLLSETLKLLDEVAERIRTTEGMVRELARSNPLVVYLRTVPGLGEFFATLIAYEIDEVHRFRNAAKLHAYVGVIPSTYSSGGKTFHGRMTKRGNKYVRWAVVEAVAPAIKKDASLRRYYEQLKARKGPNKAKIATARRLLTIIYKVMMEQRPYEVR
jgi:transposase